MKPSGPWSTAISEPHLQNALVYSNGWNVDGSRNRYLRYNSGQSVYFNNSINRSGYRDPLYGSGVLLQPHDGSRSDNVYSGGYYDCYSEADYWIDGRYQRRIQYEYKGLGAFSGPSYDAVFGANNLSVLKSQMTSRFYQKASERKLDSLVVLGEGRETLQMFYKNANTLFRKTISHEEKLFHSVLKMIKKRDITRGPNAVKQIADIASDRWLEFSFGVKPLLGDCESLGEALAEIALRRPTFKHVVGDEQNYSTTVEGVLQLPWSGYQLKALAQYSRRNYYRIGAVYGSPSNYLDMEPRSITKILGLEWQDIGISAWNLIPGSFLADYFSNVGKVIESLSYPLPAALYRYAVEIQEDKLEWSALPTATNGVVHKGTFGNGSHKKFSWKRIANPTLNVDFRFKSWDEVSPTKVANLGALAYMAFSRITSKTPSSLKAYLVQG